MKQARVAALAESFDSSNEQTGTRLASLVSNMNIMLNEIRFSLRLLRKSPSFLLTAVLSLALGIGATTTVFSAFRAVFLKPLPYAEPDRLVEISKPAPGGRTIGTTQADVEFLRQF